MGEVLRKRFHLHSGTTGQVLEDFSRWGISKDLVPKQIGGNVEVDSRKWIAERRAAGE
jgi:hypothetical protein